MIEQSTIGNGALENASLSRILDDRGKALESKDGKSRIKQASSRVESRAKEKRMAGGSSGLIVIPVCSSIEVHREMLQLRLCLVASSSSVVAGRSTTIDSCFEKDHILSKWFFMQISILSSFGRPS